MGDDKHQRRRKQKETEVEDVLLEYWRLVEIFRDFILPVWPEACAWAPPRVLTCP